MCNQRIQVIFGNRKKYSCHRKRNLQNLSALQKASFPQPAITVGLWNCQSAVNKAEFINSLTKVSDIQVLALTETWVRPENTVTPTALSVDAVFSHTPRSSGRGGGTGIIFSQSWNFSQFKPLDNIRSFEYHAVQVTAPIKAYMVVVYRPPGGHLDNFIVELDLLLSDIPDDGTPLVVMGDMNIHLDKAQATDFISLLSSFDLKLVHTPPTHKAGKTLDLILTRSCSTANLSVTPLHLSDHYFIQFSLGLPESQQCTTQLTSYRRNLRSLDQTQLSDEVSAAIASHNESFTLSVNEATDTFCSSLTSSLDKLCPLVSKPTRKSPPCPWLTEVIRMQRAGLRAAERKWHKSKQSVDLSAYQQKLSCFTSALKSAKKAFYQTKICAATDARKLFSAFNSLLSPANPQPSSMLTPDMFASYFTDKVTTISSQFSEPVLLSSLPPASEASLSSFSPLNESEVTRLLLDSKPTTCPLDPIPSHLLQAIEPTITPAVTGIINSSLSTGVFPAAFKQARVTPLLKKPSLNPVQVENYRPVSLLPFLSKILERTVFKQLSEYLQNNDLLDQYQSGFRRGHSTETALLSVTESLRLARAAGQSSVVLLLDLSAAFDTVNHQILLSTLSSLGISGSALQWFKSYLTGRSFRVSWRGGVSKLHGLSTGVPQGSVLGPLLFSIYITSLGAIIRSHGFSYHCYADDTQLFLSFPPDDTTVSARISSCLADISKWMRERHLQLNLSKTELVIIPASPTVEPQISIQLGSNNLLPTNSARNLGVMIDDQLTFKVHVASIARSCRFALYNIKKIRPYLTEHAAQLLVQALVISRIDYCNSLLAGLPVCTVKPLQMIQNAAARLVFNQPKRAHVTPLLISLHWLPVAARIKFKALIIAYKAVTKTAPVYLESLIQVYTPSRPLRSASERRLVLPAHQAPRSLARLFSSVAPKWWNDLPNSIRSAESLSTFKRNLKTLLFREHYALS